MSDYQLPKHYFIIEDNTDASIEDIEKATDAGLARAALYAESKIVESMPLNPHVEAGEGGWKKSFGSRARSKPGDPPMQQTGNLARAIISGKIGRLKYAVGTRKGYSDSPYGAFLERGTGIMRARPWLAPIFKRKRAQLNRKFEEGFKRALKGDA